MSMLGFFFKARESIVNSKLWMQRTMSYVAILNTGLLLFLVLSKLQDYRISIYITKWFIPIYIGLVLLMVLFGYIEDKIGFHREEQRASAKRNPYFDEIVARLDRIDKKIKKK